jgi:hypothetical protein
MNPYSLSVIQLALGAFLVFSSLGKVTHYSGFLRGVQEYDILPIALAKVFGIFVMIFELALAISHLTGLALSFMAQCGAILFFLFLVAIVVNLMRREQLPCYCLGTSEGEMISRKSVVRLVIMIGAEILLVRHVGFSFESMSPLQFISSAEDIVALITWSIFVLIGMTWLLSSADILRVVVLLSRGLLSKTEEGTL